MKKTKVRHVAYVYTTRQGLLHLAKCKCRWEGPIRGSAIEAVQDIKGHEEQTRLVRSER